LIDGPSLDYVLQQRRAGVGTDRPTPATPERSGVATHDLAQTGPYVEGGGSSGGNTGITSSSLSSGSGYFDTVARMLAEVADALEYAHQEGVIHRDMKPSNLLLSAQGRLSVNDFGLARLLEQPGMTLTGEFVGTPAYTWPEQITAGRTPLDHRTDIYSLGATLYEMLTLQPPFRGERRDQVLAQILHKEPKPPRSVDRKVPVDLETICQKAMEKDPDRRYQTAADMAEDLRRYVNRFAISARRSGPVRRLVKWVRRRPTVAASLAGLLLAVSLAAGLGYRAYALEERRKIEQVEAEQRLRDEQEQARAKLLDEKVRSAFLVATAGDLKRTEDAIKEIETLGGSVGQVRLLRGVVAYFRQDQESAISELEQAVKLLPQSVAARALLAMCYADYGQPDRQGPLLREIRNLSPSTPEDYLFKGYAREAHEPGAGFVEINEGLQLRDSPLGRAMRAFSRTNRAIDSGKLDEVEAALVDCSAARGMLPDNQLVLFADVYARLTAAALYQQAHDLEKRKAMFAEAGREVRALEPFIGPPNPTWMVWQYYDDIGDPEKALQTAVQAFDRSGGSTIPAWYCAVSLYRQGKFAEALSYLDRRRHPDLYGDVTRGFVLAELADGPRQALEYYHKLAHEFRESGQDPVTPDYILLLLGRKAEAQASRRDFQKPTSSSPGAPEAGAYDEALRGFRRGEISEEDLLSKAAGFGHRLCIAHFHIGLSRLADGGRAGARLHFTKAWQTHSTWSFEWNWCEMFLSRLEKDPAWPRWIAVKAR
jgi:tetratricopeptide (TPR) repeat protein